MVNSIICVTLQKKTMFLSFGFLSLTNYSLATHNHTNYSYEYLLRAVQCHNYYVIKSKISLWNELENNDFCIAFHFIFEQNHFRSISMWFRMKWNVSSGQSDSLWNNDWKFISTQGNSILRTICPTANDFKQMLISEIRTLCGEID